MVPLSQRDKDILERIQRRATQIVQELANLPYEERLRQLNLTALEDRRIRGDLIGMYKIVNGFENVVSEQFFRNRAYTGLRGHSQMLEVD